MSRSRQSKGLRGATGRWAGSRMPSASARHSTAGTIDQTNTSFSATPEASSAAASSGPMTAPALSIARCSPKARPRRSGPALAASSASRGEVRRPLPTRSAKRSSSSPGQLVTSATSGRPMPASP